MIAVIILLVLILLLFGVGFALAGFSMRIKGQSLSDARAWQEERYDLSWYDALEKRDYTVSSYDGYALHVQALMNPEPSDRWVLISHGYTDNRFGALKYARFYVRLGFNVVIYDLRGHGENEPTFCTYSIRESRDLDALIRDCRERWPDMALFGIHGESLGAATSAAVLKYAPDIDFVVADCGFSEISDVLKGAIHAMKLPEWMVSVASLCAKLRFGYSYSEMRPIDSLPGNEVPMLFFHGAEDTFIPPEHSKAMQAATAGYSELYLIPGAAHAASALTAPEDYMGYLERFIEKVEASKNA